MDVRLPDGTIIRNVPDGTTRADLVGRLKAGGMAVPSEWLDAAPPAPVDDRNRVKEVAEGVFRSAAGIGNTLLTPVRAAANYVAPGSGVAEYLNSSVDAQESLDQQNKDSNFYAGGKLVTDIAATLPVGGVVAAPIKALAARGVATKTLAPLAEAVASAGMRAGGAGVGTRVAGGAIAGGAAAGLIDPDDAAVGAVLGGALPPAITLAGKAGAGFAKKVMAPKASAGNTFANALGVPDAELARIVEAARRAPESIVPGSKLTLSQALQSESSNLPGVKMLERIVAGGPGGDDLLRRYEEQGLARLEALRNQGAQTYMGAPREEATQIGNRIGAVLRTQAGDDQGAAREAWESLYGRASRDGVALELPLDAMSDAMRPLGPGTVGAGKDAQALLRAAMDIGSDQADDVAAGVNRVGAQDTDKTLGQAVRALGISPEEMKSGGMAGEIRWLRESLKGGRGLVNKNGRRLEDLAARMYEDGYLETPDATELLSKLTEEAQGSPIFSRYANPERMAYTAQGGETPARAGMILPKPVPFEEFQRLRRSAGELGAKPTLGATEGGVLGELQRLLEGRVDDAAAGNLRPGEVMPEGFREQYNAARGMTRDNAQRYKQTNNIGAILRRPIGQDYALTGDEITNKVWHGGAGLAGDVSNLKSVLSDANREPTLDALRQFIMTDAAGKTTASGGLGAALPRYVETRMPGLQEALGTEQLEALTNVARDIRNSEAAAAVPGLRGSDTQAKIARALDAGVLDGTMAKTLARLTSFKGFGLEPFRAKAADMLITYKGKSMADLLNDPKAAAKALEDRVFADKLDRKTFDALTLIARTAPVIAAQ